MKTSNIFLIFVVMTSVGIIGTSIISNGILGAFGSLVALGVVGMCFFPVYVEIKKLD